jgi:hypothetical protein
MSGPDFDELVGGEGTPEELERLRRAHQMLVAAGPPPELSPRLTEVPTTKGRAALVPRRHRGASFLLAAGVAAAAFGIGFLVGDRGSSNFPSKRAIAMHAPAAAADRTPHASVLIGERDSVGNWPLLVRVSGLKPLPKGQWYELYLTRHGKVAAWCGSFSVKGSGRTTVRLSVPYRLKRFDGWVVTTNRRQPKPPVLLTT